MQQRSAVAERGLDAVLHLGGRLLGAPVRLWLADPAAASLLRSLHVPVDTAPDPADAVPAMLDSAVAALPAPTRPGGAASEPAPAARPLGVPRAVVDRLAGDVHARGVALAQPDPAFVGVPVTDRAGVGLGVLYALDAHPRVWTDGDVEALGLLAACVTAPLELTSLGARWESHRLRWDLAVDAAGIGSFDWDLRTDELLWDERLMQLFGYRPAEFTPRIDSFWQRTHPDDVPAVQRAVEEAMGSCGTFSAEYRVLLPGGDTRWIAARGRVLADSRGEPARMLGAAYDSTAVRLGRDQAARVLETMATGFYSLDPQWRVTYLNAEGARLLQRNPADLVGKDLWAEFPSARDLEFGRAYETAMATGEPQSFEAYYPGLGWYEVRALPGPDGLSVYFLDISARRQAQAEAAQALARLQLIAEAGAQLTSTLDVDEAVGRLAQLVVPRLGDWCVVSLDGPDGLRDIGSWHADPQLREVVAEYARVRMAAMTPSTFVARALRSSTPVSVRERFLDRLREVVDDDGVLALAERLAPESVAVVPLRAGGVTTGLLSLYRGAQREPLDDGDLAALGEIAARAGMALDNARLYTEQRRLSEELQLSLLTPPPVPVGLDLQYRYASAAQEAQVGGDWYDAFPDPRGGTLLVIGDVVGHDSRAAAAMGQLRGVLRGIAMGSGLGPAGLLTRLDESIDALHLAATATAVVAHVHRCEDGERARVRWSNAGHPPPLLLRVTGGVEQLCTGQADLLLGVDATSPRQESEVELCPGDVLLLFTDGLVERRGQPVDDGVALLSAHLARAGHRDPDAVCDAALAAMLPDRPEDDVAVVAVRVQPSGQIGLRDGAGAGQVDPGARPARVWGDHVLRPVAAPFRERDAAGQGRRGGREGSSGTMDEVLAVQSFSDVAAARRLVATTAPPLPADAAPEDDVTATAVLLTSELVTNALQHGRAPVTVSVRRAAHWLRVAVSDADPRLPRPVEAPPEDAVRGRGLYLVQRLATRWRAEALADGSGKTVWFELGHYPADASHG
ncbi:MAG: SpoIIE family protein phosphatase [Kineosporiaceae bacterium]